MITLAQARRLTPLWLRMLEFAGHGETFGDALEHARAEFPDVSVSTEELEYLLLATFRIMSRGRH